MIAIQEFNTAVFMLYDKPKLRIAGTKGIVGIKE